MTLDRIGGKRALLFAALGAGVIFAAAFYIFGDAPTPVAATSELGARPATASRAAPQPAPPADPATLTQSQIDQAAHLIGDARRLAVAGKFAEAEDALQQAEKAAPDLPQTAQARRDVAEMRTPQGQRALLAMKARSALELGDHAAAEQAIGEAERLGAQAPEFAALRRDLKAAQQKDAQKTDRLDTLLAAMRSALASKDLAAANRALNEAERIDIHDPTVLEARAELNKAQQN